MTNLLPKTFFDLHKTLDPYAIGFDSIFKEMEELASTTQKAMSYPPYNIRQVDDKTYVIELAVAGFAKSDIEVTLEGNKLVVKGQAQDETDDSSTFIFKGIANRAFTRTFTVADKIEVGNAELVNGMLKVWLNNMVKAQDAVKKIAIK